MKKPLLARITATDQHGHRCCPDLFRARCLQSVEIEVIGAPTTATLRAENDLRTTGRLIARCGGRAAYAAYIEALAAGATVVCATDGHEVEVASFAERLRAGTIWS